MQRGSVGGPVRSFSFFPLISECSGQASHCVFTKDDGWNFQETAYLVLSFSFSLPCLTSASLSRSENVQVKYRSKVVKYAWPMPQPAAESLPWVRVTLASGETVQTKLLVGLKSNHGAFVPWLVLFFICCSSGLFSDRRRWTELNGQERVGDPNGQVGL